jgi:hypothetical protein
VACGGTRSSSSQHPHDPIFCASIARAREAGADFLADEIVAIADTPMVGVKKITKPDGGIEVTEGDMIDHRRLQVHARQWHLAKIAPKKYGDRTAHEVSGPDGAAIQVQPVPPALTPPEVTAALGKLIAKAEADAGLKPGRGAMHRRVAAILGSGEYPSPDFYAAMIAGRKAGDHG